MKRLLRAAATVGLTFGLVATLAGTPQAASAARSETSAPSAAKVAAANSSGWTRAFYDDFNKPKVSRKKWSNTAPSKLSTKQCWRFTKVAGRKVVVIKSNKPWENGATSCRMATDKPFGDATYKFSARVMFHRAAGTLSSFWVTGAGPDGANEIDVIENAGQKPSKAAPPCVLKRDRKGQITRDDESATRFYGLMHNVYHAYEPRVGHRSCLAKPRAYGLYDGKFHTVTAIWRPGTNVDFAVDGRRTARFGKAWSRTSAVNALLTNKSNKPNGVGFVVDWVKVWRKS